MHIHVQTKRFVLRKTVAVFCCRSHDMLVNPFKPEFTMVIFIHYKPRIAVAILNL